MGLIDDIKHGLATRWGYQKARRDPGVEMVFAGESPLSTYDWQGFTETQRERLALTCAWVYSDVEELGRLAATSSLNMYRYEGEETVAEYDHQLERVLRNPSPRMRVGQTFVTKYSLWWLLLHGKAAWMLVYNNAGELAEFYPLPASRVAAVPHPTEYISHFQYYPLHGRTPVNLSVEQVLYVRFPNMFDYHDGLSPLSAYQMALKTDIKATEWNFNTFVNEATLRTLFSVDEVGGRYERTKAEIKEQLIDKQMRFLIAPSSKVTPHDLGIPHKDVEFLAGRKFNRSEIDRVYGFPEGYWSERANRANSEAAKATVIGGPVWSLLTLLAETFTVQVVRPHYGDEYVVLPKDIRPRDRRQDMLERKIYWPVTKLNEARAELGKGEYDGPLADAIAELPVSLATDPKFVMAYAGLAAPSGGMAAGAGAKEAAEDLRRWKSIETRRVRGGEKPGSYEFVSEWLPGGVMAAIRAALAEAESEEEVKAAFDVDLPLAAPEGQRVDRGLIELALKAGIPEPYLWPKLAKALGVEDKLEEMREFAFSEPGKPLWEPEKEVRDD